MLTRDEMDFVKPQANPQIGEIMKPRVSVVTAKKGIDTNAAYRIMKVRSWAF
jgi:hypothetical protein